MPARMIEAPIAYAARTDFRQRYYANDHSRDTVVVEAVTISISDARDADLTLDREGFICVPHKSAVQDFTDREEIARKHPAEIVELLKSLTGADEVLVTSPAVLRFSEASGRAGTLDNSHPARFAHVDATAATSAGFAARSAPPGRMITRHAHYNVWRAFSGAPQDVPLALCDARSVADGDLLSADAIFDPPGGAPEWSFESWLLAHSPDHRWHWFSDMSRDEAIVFKSSDSALGNVVPHVAFDDPHVPPGAPPRASIEMRAVAYWFA